MDAITQLKITIGGLVISNAELAAKVTEVEAARAAIQRKFDAAVDARDMPSGASAPKPDDATSNNG